MDKIREEFVKFNSRENYSDDEFKFAKKTPHYLHKAGAFYAGYKSRDEEIKKLNYKIEGMESDIRARVEIRRDLINKNKELNYLLKNLYENRYEPDKLYIYMKKVKEVIGLWIR